jgi:hypothetical protein
MTINPVIASSLVISALAAAQGVSAQNRRVELAAAGPAPELRCGPFQ